MPDENVLLSVIIVVRLHREITQQVIDAIGRQTRADALELVVVDIGDDSAPPLKVPANLRTVKVRLPAATSVSRARAEGAHRARASAVAFIEDHCVPSPAWAEALIDAHKGPWAVVGYAYAPYSRTYVARAGLMAEYGMWQVPIPSGPYPQMACNNVSYKRNILLQQGEQLEFLLTPDFVLHEKLRRERIPLFVEGRAVVSHRELHSVWTIMQGNHVYARFLASRRGRSWGIFRRTAYIVGVPLGAPAIRLVRLARSLAPRPSLWGRFIASLPVIVLVYFWSAVGESLGYVLGSRESENTVDYWELQAERSL